MPVKMWWVWIVFAAGFTIGEMCTAGFFLIWFGVGAAVAGILALLGLGPVYQWMSFVVVSAVLFTVSRRFAEKVTAKQPIGTGADRFIGKIGVVIEKIEPFKDSGLVRVEKDEWRAESDNKEVIEVGSNIKVVRLDGTHLVVQKIDSVM